MILEPHKSYIQKNPLFGRKVIHFDRIRPSVWDWELCDCSIVMIDKDPEMVRLTSVASVVYDHQGLVEIPDKVFRKIEGLVKMYEATSRVVDEQKLSVLRQETTGKIVELLSNNGIIEEDACELVYIVFINLLTDVVCGILVGVYIFADVGKH